MKKNYLPRPGLNGTYTGTCVVCLGATDTGLAFVGEAEWAIGGLHHLGIPADQAEELVTNITGCEPGYVPVGDVTLPVRVCTDCANDAGMQVGLISTGVPGYGKEAQ